MKCPAAQHAANWKKKFHDGRLPSSVRKGETNQTKQTHICIDLGPGERHPRKISLDRWGS